MEPQHPDYTIRKLRGEIATLRQVLSAIQEQASHAEMSDSEALRQMHLAVIQDLAFTVLEDGTTKK